MGIIRRKRISNGQEVQEIKEIAALQERILSVASKYVKKGGVLVYSTCTIEPEENEERVERFIKENGDFYLEDLSGLIPQTLKKEGLNKGYLQLYPNIDGVDGFFIARMIRGS